MNVRFHFRIYEEKDSLCCLFFVVFLLLPVALYIQKIIAYFCNNFLTDKPLKV